MFNIAIVALTFLGGTSAWGPTGRMPRRQLLNTVVTTTSAALVAPVVTPAADLSCPAKASNCVQVICNVNEAYKREIPENSQMCQWLIETGDVDSTFGDRRGE